jgi:hypothetical protein
MVLDVVRLVARSLAAGALARIAVKLDPDAASDAIRTTLVELIEGDGPIEISGYRGSVVTSEAREMIAPRQPSGIRELQEDQPLVGSIRARRG